MGDWKLIEFYEDNRIELYNLEQDSGERHDLAAPEHAAGRRDTPETSHLARGAGGSHADAESGVPVATEQKTTLSRPVR